MKKNWLLLPKRLRQVIAFSVGSFLVILGLALVVLPERIYTALAASSTNALEKVLFSPLANPKRIVKSKIANATVKPERRLRVLFLFIL